MVDYGHCSQVQDNCGTLFCDAGRVGEVADAEGVLEVTATRRVELNLGWACNNHCLFCGEQERRERSRQEGMFKIPGDKVRADLARYRREGYNHVTFLGGEPTIRRDIAALVRFACRIGFSNVFITTNGRRFADRRFLRELLRAGLTDVCVSVHGPGAEVHDKLTDQPGSFAETERGLLNLVLEGCRFHTSSVITSINAPHLAEMVRYLNRFRPLHLFMALPNPTGGAYRDFARLYPRFKVAGTHVREALAVARDLGQLVTVAKLPFCHLQGFEGYADDLFWGREQRRHINTQIDAEEAGTPRIDQRFADRCAHPLTCRTCRFRFLCEGIEAFYLIRRGPAELEPVPGEPVRRPSELWPSGPRDRETGSFLDSARAVSSAGRAENECRSVDHGGRDE